MHWKRTQSRIDAPPYKVRVVVIWTPLHLHVVVVCESLLGGQDKARCTVSDRAQHQFFKLNGWSVKEMVGSITTRNFENFFISVVSLAIAEQLSV